MSELSTVQLLALAWLVLMAVAATAAGLVGWLTARGQDQEVLLGSE